MVKTQIKSYIKIGKKVYKGSPTETLIDDLVNDLGGTATVLVINAIKLVDDTDTERDSENIYTTDWSFTILTNGYRGACSKTISITADYNVAKIRLYASDRLYFEYVLSTPEAVQSGGQFKVDITIDVTVSLSHTGGTLVSITGENVLGEFILKRFTNGDYRGNSIDKLCIYYQSIQQTCLSTTINIDTANNKVTITVTYTPTSDINMDEYRWNNSTANIDVVVVKIEAVTLSANVQHSWTLTIQF